MEATGLHHAHGRRSGSVPARGERAAAGDADNRRRRPVRRFILATLGIVAFAIVDDAKAQALTLRVACYGGVFTQVQAKYAGALFTSRTGIRIQWIDGNPTDHLARMIASRGRAAPFDVVYYDDLVQDAAIRAHVVMKIDPAVVTNLDYLYDIARQQDGYGPGMNFYSVGFAYNTRIFKDNGIPEPTSWDDMWNPKLAGHIALPDITQSTAKDVVIATARLLGGDERNADAAFPRLAQIRPLYYYQSSADLEAKMSNGEAWIVPWNNARPATLIAKGVPLKFVHPKEGGFGHQTVIDVVAGTPQVKEAMTFVNYVVDPLNQLGQAYEVPYGPTNRLLAPVIGAYPDLARQFPSSPEDLKKLYRPDPAIVNANTPRWVDMWNRIVRH
jgi:putative spermidine/putrescine transport system substrate-binding protein